MRFELHCGLSAVLIPSLLQSLCTMLQVGMKIQRRLEPTKELLTATVMAVHPETVHFSEFSDAEGRPLVCFKATHPHLYLSGQNYKSTALIKEFPGGSSHDGFHVEYRGYTGQYIFGVRGHRSVHM